MHLPKSSGIPVFVMLPLDTVNADGVFKYASCSWFSQALTLLGNTGAYGVAVDVWWGAVERSPGHYTWNGYRQLLEAVRQAGLKLQVVLSYHACGDNVGDNTHIPLPAWVLRCGDSDPDLFFTDRPRGGGQGQRNREYLSIWADEAPGVLAGRSVIQCYEELMVSFRDTFCQALGSVIEEVVVGSGPCGELRFPSYLEAHGWRFPGVGEFQCYDRRALASLADAAREAGHDEWGHGGPHDCGEYNSQPEETGFYNHEGSWDSPYGRFFLGWYSNSLMQHGQRLMAAANRVFKPGRMSEVASPSDRQYPSVRSAACSAAISVETGHSEQAEKYNSGAGSDASIDTTLMAAQARDVTLGATPSCSDHMAAVQMGSGKNRIELSSIHLSSMTTEAVLLATEVEHSSSSMSLLAEGDTLLHVAATPMLLEGSPLLPGRKSELMMSSLDITGVDDQVLEELSEFESPDMMAAAVAESRDVFLMTAASDGGGVCGRRDSGVSVATPPSSTKGAEGLKGRGFCSASEPDLRRKERERRQMTYHVALTLKIAGIHWWFRSRSHAAELTAGYYNTATRDGYANVVDICAKHGFGLTLTCVEMCDNQHPPPAKCGPEGLLKQMRSLCALKGVPLSGENALSIFQARGVDTTALDRVVFNTRAWHGSATMSSYWGSRSHQGLVVPSTGIMHAMSPHSPDATTGNGGGLLASAGGSAGFSTSINSLQQHHVRLSGHPSVSSLTKYSGRSSVNGADGSEASPHHMHSGGGARRFSNLFYSSRSDPAIAATGLKVDSYADMSEPLPAMRSFTFLRLGPEILQPKYHTPWMKFMWKMREGGFC
ncbi:hypothetical protein CEUSTIGMA_g11454.t1 [Chlamydomonas eustigma]|uniref:Beta-amylase n=1 Tax=Chlamydomonas eustigma TaxID=1157962 RepID=A0A250XML5_9CHLO|nr:hypothetical protein CEUSTIGMA_g11454.t1 [Chlamydomonas eustigma]|eukprot:GAX84030.1 hypothetical protein CEUSTIGMA_g11454.t1 [Chlamydomonas eustigma]